MVKYKKYKSETISPLEQSRADRINNKNYNEAVDRELDKSLKQHHKEIDEDNARSTMAPRPGAEVSRGHTGSKEHPRG